MKCKVCDGRGYIWKLPEDTDTEGWEGNLEIHSCRTCGGTGEIMIENKLNVYEVECDYIYIYICAASPERAKEIYMKVMR